MNTKVRAQLSVMMFLQYFIWGSWYVTLGTYLTNGLKFDGGQTGNAYSTINFAAMIAPIFVGMIADRFFSSEKVLALLHLIGGAMLILAAQQQSYPLFFSALLAHALCYMPTMALTNSIAFSQMTDAGTQFPGVRVLGTIGWIAAGLAISYVKLDSSTQLLSFVFQKTVPVVGSISEVTDAMTGRRFTVLDFTKIPLYFGAVASFLLAAYALTLPHTPPKEKGKKVTFGDVIGLPALRLFNDLSFSMFALGSFLVCIPLAFYYNFTGLFLADLGVDKAAAKMTYGQMSEIFFMLVMPLFFKRLGVKKMLLIGMAAWVTRYVLFAYGNGGELAWMLILGIVLHGVCYDFFFVTGQIYVDRKAPNEIRSAAQGLIAFLTYGGGMFVGSIISGQVLKAYTLTAPAVGHQWYNIWIIPAIGAAGVFLLFLVAFREKEEA